MSGRPRKTPAAVGAIIAAVCALVALVLTELIIHHTTVWYLDEAVAAAVPAWRTSTLTAVMQPVTHLGDALVAGGLTLAVGVALLLSSRLRASGVALLVVAAGSAATGEVVKRFGDRARPPSEFAIANLPDPYSFPSGHSAATMLLACMLGYLALRHVRWPWSVALASLGIALAIAVGISRVYLGVHWPTDVLGGWLVAWAWAALGIGAIRTWGERTRTDSGVTRAGTSA